MIGELLVRADVSENVGAGHVMRGLTLAAEWVRRGGRAILLCAVPPPGITERAITAGVELQRVDASAGSEADLARMVVLASSRHSGRSPLWIALDGYGFSFDYQARLRNAGGRVLVIDDTAHQPRYSADVILNQNGGADDLVYCANSDTRLLLGPRFALLRPEFRSIRTPPRPVQARIENVLITFGGSDPANYTVRTLRALRQQGLTSVALRTVLGPANVHSAAVRSEIALWPNPGHVLLEDARDVSRHMAWADLAIGAAGSTVWELACCGLPAVLFVTAGNQERSAAAAEASGVALNLGEWSDGRTEEQLARAINLRLASAEVRTSMAERGHALVDGCGAERVVNVLTALH